MAITAAIELSSTVRAPSHSVQKVRRPLVGRPAQVTAFKQRIASQPASDTGEAAKTALASAIPKTEELPGALIEAQRKRIFYFILKHFNHRDDAEDLTHEALLQAYLSFASFQGQSSFSTWMTGIALNLVRNHVNRAPQRRYCFVDEEALHEVASDRGDPVAETQFEQLLERLEEELPKLPPALREALVLVAVRGLSYEEVAQIQKTTVENVKNRLFRARQALRETVLES
ncbi:MAG: RNA polymerase sigma factor [Candidatus Competibacter sp.]